MFQQLLFPTIFYLIIITQCKLSIASIEDSMSITWTNVDMKTDTWPGIKNLIGQDPCAENKKHCFELATIIKPMQGATALRKDCEYDYQVKYPNGTLRLICWIRMKETNENFSKKTVYESQYWTENGTESRLRWAAPAYSP